MEHTAAPAYSVSRVAALAGLTVRTLHHYDEIGLLVPSGRSPAGYRRYDDADLERLQRIMFYRELGFSLNEIATILDDPDAGPLEHLRRQHRLLTERIARLRAMVAAVEKAMEARSMNISLTPNERFEVFGDFDPDDYAEEVEARWGHTEAYRQSQERVAHYTKQDWQAINGEREDIERRLVAVMRSGAAPDSAPAMELAEQHRQHICRWFYDCGYDLHRRLGEMWVGDERFRRRYEELAEGLAEFFRDATLANAARGAGD